MWAADARDGFHGGGAGTRWVTDDDEAAAVDRRARRRTATRVRIMPFLDGIATSVHGIVLPDGVVALRPVELVTLRRGHELRYSGCATFWDPPDDVRDEMRDAARRVGEQLRAEVDFRGAFTLDGVATVDGFRPTELNPRFGAGLSVITRGLGDVPLHLVLDLVVAGIALADLRRRAGAPRSSPPPTPTAAAARGSCTSTRRSRSTGRVRATTTASGAGPATASPADANVVASDGFVRATFDRRPHARRAERRSARRSTSGASPTPSWAPASARSPPRSTSPAIPCRLGSLSDRPASSESLRSCGRRRSSTRP